MSWNKGNNRNNMHGAKKTGVCFKHIYVGNIEAQVYVIV